MSITKDCANYAERAYPVTRESDATSLARNRFLAYLECFSAHAGCDLYDEHTWHALSAKDRQAWIDQAQHDIKVARRKRRK